MTLPGTDGSGSERASAERVQELVQKALEENRPLEEVCRESPELLPRVRERLLQARALDAQLDDLFPTPRSEAPAEPASVTLPRIPGYEFEGVLGHGGMGVVYRARHLRLGRPVALKMLLAGPWAARVEIERFVREAAALASLCHRNIVQVFDAGELDGRPFFTMELVEGGTLAQRLAGKPLPTAAATALLIDLADAVHFAHSGGIVHRDLKPANILLALDGTPKISDFGLARRIDAGSGVTSSGARLGTPSYMAPEQALGLPEATRPAVDVHALGALLYEALTGGPPFRGASVAETERAVVTQDPAPPSRLAHVPRDLETICLHCLRKEPERRYATAADLAEDLRRFQRGEPIAARPVSPGERAVRWVRRNPSRAGLTVMGLVLLAIALRVATHEWTLAAHERVEVERWNERLATVRTLQQEARFDEARAVLARVAGAGSAEVRGRVERAEADLRLVERLDAIRSRRGDAGRVDRHDPATVAEYEAAFREGGLGGLDEPADVVSRRIAASDVRVALLAALHDWAFAVQDRGQLAHLLAIARLVDPDPWRDRVRDPSRWEDAAALAELARDAVPTEQPPALLLMVAGLLHAAGGDELAFLRRVQLAHPADFWVNFALAEALGATDEALGYYRAALALRPRAIAICVNLAIVLVGLDRDDEAAQYWRRAVEIEPASAVVRCNVALFLLDQEERPDAAAQEARESLRFDETHPYAHAVLGRALLELGRFAEAASALATARTRIPPGDPRHAAVLAATADCERMLALEPRYAAVREAGEPPANATEALELARIARRRGDPATAAELYAQAFDGDPALAEASGATNRYDAACAAALAGAESDTDAGAAERGARADRRAQALQWLWSELAFRGSEIESGRRDAREHLRATLVRWRRDPDLAGLRDDHALAALAPAERDECLALWTEVAALLEQASREPR